MTAMDYRQYDNALGRFNGIDALAELMPDITGYHFGFNNPVYWGDPSGLKPSSNMSALQLANTAFSNTEEGTNSYWVNDGVGNFDYAGDGFGGGSSNLAGSFINSYGAFVSGFDSSTDFENGSYVVYNGNPDAGLLHTVVVQAYKSKGVGQPGSWESAIPVWGSGRAAYDHFQNGNYWRGIGYSALALSDLFLVKAAVTAIGKGIAVGVSKMAVVEGAQIVETAVAPRIISSMSGHSVNQAITRGFTSPDILKIVREGTATMGKSKFGNPQWRYMMNGNTVIIDASKNRIITIFSNAKGTANKMGAGNINPF